MQRGPHSRKQQGRYNPNAPDYYRVHRPGPAPNFFWTLPEAAERPERKSALPSRKWRLVGARKVLIARANTKSEARARFKTMFGDKYLFLDKRLKVLAA